MGCESVRESTNTTDFLKNLNFVLDQFAKFLHNAFNKSEIGPEDASPGSVLPSFRDVVTEITRRGTQKEKNIEKAHENNVSIH
jgi:hypothetical protein